MWAWLFLGLWLGAPLSVAALAVQGDDAAQSQAPAAGDGFPAFPYWDHVVRRGSLSAVYLGQRWVLTADHVGMGDVTVRGKRFAPDPETEIDLRTTMVPADLVLFRLREDPGLPALPLAQRRPALGEETLLLGWGQSAGEPLEWRGRPGRALRNGDRKLRWGRNRIHRVGVHSGAQGYLTETFGVRFDLGRGAPAAECQGAHGDSGGAVFVRDAAGTGWSLGGLLILVRRHPGQPAATVLAGNETFAADLGYYREQIEAITGLR